MQDFIGAVERRLHGHKIVQRTIGNVHAAGTYEVCVVSSFDPFPGYKAVLHLSVLFGGPQE